MQNIIAQILKVRQAKIDAVNAASVNDVSSEEYVHLKGVTSGIQGQINALDKKKRFENCQRDISFGHC